VVADVPTMVSSTSRSTSIAAYMTCWLSPMIAL
jgi:hypothetical protein